MDGGGGERDNVASLSSADGGGAALGQGGFSWLQDALGAWGSISQSSSQASHSLLKQRWGQSRGFWVSWQKNLKYLEGKYSAWHG